MYRAIILMAMLLTLGTPLSATAQSVAGLVISEVYYDAPGTDDGLEWVELYNGFAETVDLCEYCLAWGGASYPIARG